MLRYTESTMNIQEILQRGVERVYPNAETLEKVLRSSKKLTFIVALIRVPRRYISAMRFSLPNLLSYKNWSQHYFFGSEILPE